MTCKLFEIVLGRAYSEYHEKLRAVCKCAVRRFCRKIRSRACPRDHSGAATAAIQQPSRQGEHTGIEKNKQAAGLKCNRQTGFSAELPVRGKYMLQRHKIFHFRDSSFFCGTSGVGFLQNSRTPFSLKRISCARFLPRAASKCYPFRHTILHNIENNRVSRFIRNQPSRYDLRHPHVASLPPPVAPRRVRRPRL